MQLNVSFFEQDRPKSMFLKDIESNVSVAVGARGLHGDSVNYFVQIGTYDNQKENEKQQQKVFLDLHR
jgi:hypothetical protein